LRHNWLDEAGMIGKLSLGCLAIAACWNRMSDRVRLKRSSVAGL
jgi:hypothetical protein